MKIVQGDEPMHLFKNGRLSEEEQREMLLQVYSQLKQSIDRLDKANGQKKWPAKSCYHLANDHPNLESDHYWIDPNGGDKRDAILVYCDMPKKATCVLPQPDKSDHIDYNGSEFEIWLSEITGGMEVSVTQMNILILFFRS